MLESAPERIRYKRSNFFTRLPVDRLYTPSHFWIGEEEAGVWRVGLTQFAIRMLGDLVEYEFKVAAGDEVAVGGVLGWIEGFKALSDLYCVAAGRFAGDNPALREDPTLLDAAPYTTGWLYRVHGVPDQASLDVAGYVAVLDATIDRVLAERHE